MAASDSCTTVVASNTTAAITSNIEDRMLDENITNNISNETLSPIREDKQPQPGPSAATKRPRTDNNDDMRPTDPLNRFPIATKPLYTSKARTSTERSFC